MQSDKSNIPLISGRMALHGLCIYRNIDACTILYKINQDLCNNNVKFYMKHFSNPHSRGFLIHVETTASFHVHSSFASSNLQNDLILKKNYTWKATDSRYTWAMRHWATQVERWPYLFGGKFAQNYGTTQTQNNRYLNQPFICFCHSFLRISSFQR